VEWLWLIVALLTGAGAGSAGAWVILRRQRATQPAPSIRWPIVLVPMLISEDSRVELPKGALSAAFSLATDGKVVFDLFIEVPRSHSLEAQLVAQTETSLKLIEMAENEARKFGHTLECNIQKVRDYGYGVAEAARLLGAKAAVLQAAIVHHSPSQRGELGSSVRQPNTSAMAVLLHDRAGCDVLLVLGVVHK
jgi:hypothetical protein